MMEFSVSSLPFLSYVDMKDFSGIEKVFNRTMEDRRNFLENYGYTTLPYRYIYRYLQQ